MPSKGKVLHYLGEYLQITMTWVYTQIKYNAHYEHLIATQHTANLDIFPTQHILSLENFSRKRQLYNKALYRITGYYPDFLKEFRPEKPNLVQAHFGHYGFKALGLKRQLNIPMATFFFLQN